MVLPWALSPELWGPKRRGPGGAWGPGAPIAALQRRLIRPLRQENIYIGDKCDYASLCTGNLRAHLRIHSGDRPNKCSQCNLTSVNAGHFSTWVKSYKYNQHIFCVCSGKSIKGSFEIYTQEKSNKCKQCDYAQIQAGNFMIHIWFHWLMLQLIMHLCILRFQFNSSFALILIATTLDSLVFWLPVKIQIAFLCSFILTLITIIFNHFMSFLLIILLMLLYSHTVHN